MSTTEHQDPRLALVADALFIMGTPLAEVAEHPTYSTVRAVIAGEPVPLADLDAARRSITRIFGLMDPSEHTPDHDLAADVRRAVERERAVRRALDGGLTRTEAMLVAHYLHDTEVA